MSSPKPVFTVSTFRRFLESAGDTLTFGCQSDACPLAKAFSVVVHANGTWGDEKQLLPRWAAHFVKEYDQRMHAKYSIRDLLSTPEMGVLSASECLNILKWVDRYDDGH